MTIVKLILFLIWTLLALAFMAFVIRILWRGLRALHGDRSGDTAERILDTAGEIGVDTTAVRKLLEITIGKPIGDPALIEGRTYGRLEIEYFARLHEVEGERQLVLIIKDEAVKPTLIDFSQRKDEYRIPIRRGAIHTVLSILENDEDRFMRTAADYESQIQTRQIIEKEPLREAENTVLRWFAFLPLKDLGRIDQISKCVPLTSHRQIQYELDISAYVGKEFDEIILVLRFEVKYRETGVPGRLHNILYYPFGAHGRENLRKMLKEAA